MLEKRAYKMSHAIVDGAWQPVWRLYHDNEHVRDFIGNGRALMADGYSLASAATWGRLYVSRKEFGDA